MSEDVVGPLVDLIAERVAAKIAAPQPASDDGLASWRLWTLEETAKRLTRSPRWVRGKAKAGELAVVRLDGGALAFDPEDVVAFARRRHIGGDPEPRVVGTEWWRERLA